ncbi:hypothetical protein CCACVL1_23610 [Corchorus capsularis]|uniref:HAT C-terminal dimerisation domain-containing protein n=1 Tax=Corchorus capsularis TaxID=210143 RepID=A0A1R3GT68_COCAP|nr:hypothetical protein CCACVL1_23610 [Corchorus capsularis]
MGTLVAETICSKYFWDDVENVVAITKPIYLMTKFCDGEGAKMGEIFEKMDNMLGQIKDITRGNKYEEDYLSMQKIILQRWEKLNMPLHSLAFALSPRFYDIRYLKTLAPGGVPRRAPNCYREVVVGVMEAFKRIAENLNEEKTLREQFATFHMKKGVFAMAPAQVDAVTMDAIEWWSTYGLESQPISSSSAERAWSTYSYIHNVKRNRLNCTRAGKLVFIHSNTRLLSRFNQSYEDDPFKKWDIDPDNAYEVRRLEMDCFRL